LVGRHVNHRRSLVRQYQSARIHTNP
jgi:hypothetical protein